MKNMKKLASLVLALVMVFSLATTAFAADEEVTTVKLNIATVDGHTYKVYQLLTGELSNLTDGTGTLSNTKVGSNAKSSATVGSIDAALKDADGNYLANGALGDAAYAQIDTESEPYASVEGDGNTITTEVDPGYYVVVDSWTEGAIEGDALSRYLVAVVGETTMTPKTTTTDIDKKIIDTDANKALDDSKKTDTAAIGDTIEYEITGTVPNTEGYKYYYYVVDDTMSKGLTLDENSFTVTIGTKTLTKGTDYYVYVTKNDDGTTSFQLALEDLKELVDTADNGVSVGAAISIKYNATVDDDAVIGIDPNTNKAKLEYSNNPGESERNDVEDKPGTPNPGTAVGEGPEKTTKTYVTELTIQKVDNENMPLEGAEFTLSGTNLNQVILTTATEFKTAGEGETAEYYELTDGTYTTTAPSNAAEGEEGYNADLYKNPTAPTHVRVTTLTTTTAISGETTKTVVGTVDAAGLVTFTGLNAGTYTLTETKTPAGYNTIAPITFTISATQSGSTALVGGSINWASDNDVIVLDATNGVFDATIVNYPGTNLPTTGGMGTTLFYVLGGIMVLAAVVLLVTKKRVAQ